MRCLQRTRRWPPGREEGGIFGSVAARQCSWQRCLASLWPTHTHRHTGTCCPANRRILDILRIRMWARQDTLVLMCVCVKGRLTGCQKKCIAGLLSPGAPSLRPGFVAAERCHWLVRPSAVAAENRLDLLGLLLNWPTRLPLGFQLLQ